MPEFCSMARELGHSQPFMVYSQASFDALKEAGLEVSRA